MKKFIIAAMLLLMTLASSAHKSKPQPPSPTILPNTFGAQSTLVMLVNFQDGQTQPFTVADAQSMFFTTVDSFIRENSYGQTWLTGTAVGWYTIPDSILTCNSGQMALDAQAAAVAHGVVLANYTRYVYVFPYNTVCGSAGFSLIGGNPSQNWINGNSLDQHIIAHEMGHAFGLWHSHSLDCGVAATICSNGTVNEYGDLLDVMGQPHTATPEYNAFQKERLGWVGYGTSPAVTTVTLSGTYPLGVYEVQNSTVKVLKILKSTDASGVKTWYYLEQRQALGFDSFLSNSIYSSQNETSGVLVHIGTDGNGSTGELLDMTPATPISTGWFDASLAVGQTFQDIGAGVSFTVLSVSPVNGASVSIQVPIQHGH